jgi:hypothetical protein
MNVSSLLISLNQLAKSLIQPHPQHTTPHHTTPRSIDSLDIKPVVQSSFEDVFRAQVYRA